MGKHKIRPRFIAYRFADPMTSPKIKQSESLPDLLAYLSDRETPRVFGPAIYYLPVTGGRLVDRKIGAVGVGLWQGGMKILLFEGASEYPAPGVEYVKPIEFIDD